MAGSWQRVFVAAARSCAWCALFVPLAVIAVLIVASALGRQPPSIVVFLGDMVVQLAAMLALAIVAAGIGASIGAGTAMLIHEFASQRARGPFQAAIGVLSSFPAAVLGWFGAVVVLPALPAGTALAAYAAATAVVIVAVVPRACAITARALDRVPTGVREAAASAGATAPSIAAHVVLPAIRSRLWGVYLDAFSRAVSEAAAVTVVFLAAIRAGFPVAVLTLPSWTLAHARAVASVDAGIAQAALVILVVAIASKTMAARRIGELQWA